ncbi:DUF2484 family protein [Defluviimonas sp. WL0002]|nr:DUF2484 family protein [Defluviimonas sp. WL0002]
MLAIGAAAAWFVVATTVAFTPTRDHHWRAAYVLIALGIPILVAVFWQSGPWAGMAVLAGAMSILRWPVIYLFRWLRRLASGR